MERTTSPNHDNNLFSEGNPAAGIPATTVGADDMNDHQEEICNAIERSGATLASDRDQLADAIETIAAKGGAQVSASIDNNQTNQDVTGLSFDKTSVKAARVLFSIERSDDTPTVTNEVGEMYVAHDSVNDAWKISTQSQIDDSGVTFNITSAGQIQYSSSDYTGGNYAGAAKFTVTELLV